MSTREDLEVLGLEPGASLPEIKQAYRDMARVWHPDRFGSDERLQAVAEEKLKRINEAYHALLENPPGPTEKAEERWQPREPAPPPQTAAERPRREPPENARFPAARLVVVAGVLAGLGVGVVLFASRTATQPSGDSVSVTAMTPDTATTELIPAVQSESPARPAREAPSGAEKPLGSIRIKSTVADVVVALGRPTRQEGDTWWYGRDRIVFSNGLVVGYANPCGWFRIEDPSEGMETVGSVMIEDPDSAAAVAEEAERERRRREEEERGDDWWWPWERQ